MRHTLRLHGVIVGHSDLERVDVEARRASGAFRPGLGYDLVQPVFRLYSRAVALDGTTRDAELLERYHGARDALQLELQDADGHAIPASTIHISDYRDEDASALPQLDVLIADDEYWRRRLNEGRWVASGTAKD